MIIAEIGMNHLGVFSSAEIMLMDLFNTKVDGITFQVREKEYYDRNPKYRLEDKDYIELSKQIKNTNKKFGIALADFQKIDFFESINVDFYKVIRNDMANTKLMDKLLSLNKKIIVSTGLSSDQDIKIFMNKYKNNKNIVLNHTQLSHEINDCNLKAITTLKEKYNCKVSYGNHCDNLNTLYMSLCYSPSDILFYVKDGNSHWPVKYPDDEHAIALNDVQTVVNNLKILKHAIGTGIKTKIKNKI
jgi:sialic acid synthase SpsE